MMPVFVIVGAIVLFWAWQRQDAQDAQDRQRTAEGLDRILRKHRRG